MIVSLWMTRELVTISPDTPIVAAAALMAQRRIRRLLVVDHPAPSSHLLGIISAKDILHAFPPDVNPFAVTAPDIGSLPVTAAQIMTHQPVTTTPETPIEEAARLMDEKKIGSLPVLHDHHLIGIITESDIFRAFVSFFDAPENSARITFDASNGEDVFGFISRTARQRHLRVLSLISSVQQGIPVCVVRVASPHIDGFLEDLWNSDHRVINVLRFDRAGGGHQPQ